MEAVFLRVLNMSLSAAAVIAVVVLLRLVLRRAPNKWRYLLWIAPAFRLACPVSFRAVFSIFRLRPPLEAASAPAAAGVGNMTYITRPIVLSTPTGFFSRFGPCKSTRDPIPTTLPKYSIV